MKPLIGRVHSGYTIIGALLYPHKEDTHLYLVLGRAEDGAYVVWTHNTQVDGFGTGYYFVPRPNENAQHKALHEFTGRYKNLMMLAEG